MDETAKLLKGAYTHVKTTSDDVAKRFDFHDILLWAPHSGTRTEFVAQTLGRLGFAFALTQ